MCNNDCKKGKKSNSLIFHLLHIACNLKPLWRGQLLDPQNVWHTLLIIHLSFIGMKLYLELLAVVWWFSLDFCYISFIQFGFLLHFLYYISSKSDNNVNVQFVQNAMTNSESDVTFHHFTAACTITLVADMVYCLCFMKSTW